MQFIDVWNLISFERWDRNLHLVVEVLTTKVESLCCEQASSWTWNNGEIEIERSKWTSPHMDYCMPMFNDVIDINQLQVSEKGV